MNSLKQALDEKRFACVLEVIPQQSPARLAALEPIMRRGQLAGWPLLPAFADRVGPHADLSPLQGAGALGDPASSLLHFSGKDRERADLLRQMAAMGARGLKQLLLLSGDRLPGHDPGRAPVRYLESVPALQIAREHGPDWLLGAALNPFKYREEEGGAQYLKARKKLLAGADFLTLQLGFDAAKHIEAQAWMHTQPGAKPMLACVMNLSERRADVLQAVPGIVITESMRQLLGKEREVSHAYASARSLARLALQIVGLQWMGYAGVHLSGVHTLDELLLLEQAIIEQRGKVTSLADWSERWQAGWRLPGAPEVRFTPGIDAWTLGQADVVATRRERLRYALLATVHEQFFDRAGWFSRAFGWSVTRPMWQAGVAANALRAVERTIKRPLVGCDTCGSCRLQDTLYVCPETCPKGLANGPCGGTRLNRCEFGDRECVHSVKYRIAKSTNQLPALAQTLIPGVEAQDRHRSSWPEWFKRGDSAPGS
ncbi:methylenetetrahydrofolate reductase C-terminal domain-containing protein [Achromobacter ruhlandii]|uniref:Methylenetetrahydrofolate reductase n=1 Tax=Achromobacter ruhlandii TaxID=72557 RepID=A0ABM8M3J4_9BURK|nr:methylenetetrahydrofolate reductase C-terminal domain-containing protein [Achromobacter ruhlandii]AKP87803.1 bifunctional homocysteine S-methyltransferase/5,10-methylenetetrahydrofolate reductase protein [Achromobacter xylosoxidans]AOU96344.1 5,10-methylenetetrahydrofolate reductase [Achromobacter ruhlandii]MCZ8433688.1 methylenetetrahydrofolate reductase C-terminal domain-containing protein [Achromobacter ruhlandii]MDC6089236.1 methylenetetrahydrofolate reductase C-terminal domain-containin